MSKIVDDFWKSVTEPQEARETVEKATRKEEWDRAIRNFSSIAIAGKHALPILRKLTQAIGSCTNCMDLTHLPDDELAVTNAFKAAFPSWGGRFLVLGLGPRHESRKSAVGQLEESAFEAACNAGSSYAICLESSKDFLSYATEFSTDTPWIIKKASFVIINEEAPDSDTMHKMGTMMHSYQRISAFTFCTDNVEVAAKRVVFAALELFEAAATL